jgi:AhpD family alkylhydroperoxidase
MEQRLKYREVFPEAVQALAQLGKTAHSAGLDKKLVALLEVRTSLLNGCSYCIDMHTKEARQLGETEQRLYALAAWEEAPFFTEQERAALAWTDAVTNIQTSRAKDEVYERIRAQFSEHDVVALTMVVITMNAWNRLALAFRPVPGTPPQARAAAV